MFNYSYEIYNSSYLLCLSSVEAIYPVPTDIDSIKDTRIASLYQYAVRVERAMFDAATSRVSYIF